MKHTQGARKALVKQKLIVAAVASVCAGSALAIELNLDNGWTGSVNTTLSVGASWRVDDAEEGLVHSANRTITNLGGPADRYDNAGHRTQIGNLNYQDAGDQFSETYKVYSELNLSNGTVGGKISGKAWYDRVLNRENVDLGSPNSGATRATAYAAVGGGYDGRLNDSGASRLSKFDGVYLLDAYAFVNADVANMPVQVRAGRQAVNWGESIFFQGVNQISPLDVGSLRRAGSEIKEALLPIWSLTANVGLPGGVSMDMFYQFQWAPTELEACGTFWAGSTNISARPGNCNIFNLAAGSVAYVTPQAGNQTGGGDLGIEIENGRKGSDSGQYGIAFKLPVDAIDTELGLYAMKINSRTPVIGVLPRSTGTPLGGAANTGSAITFDYPDNIQIYGITAATTLAGYSVAAELSHQRDVPVSLNADDLDGGLVGNFYATGAGGTPLQRADILAQVVSARNAGQKFNAWDRFNKTQFQINGVGTESNLSKMLGAISGLVVGEVMGQWNNIPEFDPHKAGAVRYGGSGGSVGSFTNSAGVFFDACNFDYTTTNPATGAPTFVLTPKKATGEYQEFCKGKHYITDFAWGYKLRYSLEYPDVFGSGVTATPSLFFAHDVEGVSLDTQLQEDRKTIATGLKLNYNKVHNLQFDYVTYSGKWNTLRDRDNVSVSYNYTF